MFKEKNNITKVSNGLLLTMIILSVFIVVTIMSEGITDTVTYSDYIYNIIIYGSYCLFGVILLILTNKLFNLYKDEYPTSRNIFNMFILFSIYSMLIMLCSYIFEYIIYDNLDITNLLFVFIGLIPCYALAFTMVEKKDLLSKNNDSKTNVTNLVIIYLLMEYSMSVINILLCMIFNVGEIIALLQNLCFSLMFLCIILLSYKMIYRVK